MQQTPQDTINYYQKHFPRRWRPMQIPQVILRLHNPGGWFQWYANFYNGERSEADIFRVEQWKAELLTISFYIRTAITNDSNIVDKWQNNSHEFLYKWRQYLLEYGWHPNIDPLPFIL